MYESKEKSEEETASGKAALGDSKEDTQKSSEENLLSSSSEPSADRGSSPTTNPKLSVLQSHPLLNPRPGTPLHLAMMQQQLQHSVLHPPGSGSQAAAVSVQTALQNVPSWSGLPHMHSQLEHHPSQRSSSPMGLAKWFGSDVLQQPLPSMPTKVNSVDELEYRQ
ncbi:hypothetical protein P7K49_000602 [Saguinus oedipus]|uniref:Uncharacterized protein n=1 Tax=Saguinus oedipus TaxID=9490 RepID=A0ABQ9WC62_SAGOE|nr:hypothetical protein P7K49_000602 [Saguinus oedipus]